MFDITWHFYFTGRPKSKRLCRPPPRFNVYWDMNIPTEYYQSEFIEFEEFMQVLGNTKQSSREKPHAGADHMLLMFRCYEEFQRSENKKIKLEEMKSRQKKQDKRAVIPKIEKKQSAEQYSRNHVNYHCMLFIYLG